MIGLMMDWQMETMTSMHLLPDSHASSVDQERLNAIGLGLVATDAPGLGVLVNILRQGE